MSSAGGNTRISDHRGHRHSRTARNRADAESAAHFDPHCSEDFDDLSLLPLCTQISYTRFDDPSSSETSISADRGSDFPHAPGAAASLTSFNTNKNQLQQPLQMLPTLSFQKAHSASAGAVDTSPADRVDDPEDRRQRNEQPERLQEDCQANGNARLLPWLTMSYPPSSAGSHNVARAPALSSVTASCFDVGPNGVSGAYSDFMGCVSGASGCGDGASAAAVAWPDSGGGGSVSTLRQGEHRSSNLGTANTGGDRGGNGEIADGNEHAMLQPQLLQMLLQQQLQPHQPQGTAPPNSFIPSSSPRANALGGLEESCTAGSATTMPAISACLMQLMSGNGGNEAGQTTPHAPLQQLFVLNPLPPPSPSTEPAPRAPQGNNIIDSDSVPTATSLGTPGAGTVYDEAQIRGNTATKSLASTRARGNGSNNPAASLSGSLGQTSLYPYHFVSRPPPPASRKGSDSGAHINTLAPAVLLPAMNPLHHAFSPPSPSGAATLPMLSAGMYSLFTGAVPYCQPGLPPPPPPTAAQSQPPLKPTSRAGNRHGGRGHGTAPATGNHNTSAGGNNRNGSRRQQVDDDGHANSGKGAAAHTAGDAHTEPKNGANFVVGAWYEGVVKRYNPLRGFGFLTCTHQLRFDPHACERACTRHADAVPEKQQQRELEKAAAAATTSTRATLQSVSEDEPEQGEQQLQSLSNRSVSHADDTSAALLLTSMDSVKKGDICLPHKSVAAEAHRESDNDAAAPAATTDTNDAEVAEASDPTLSSATATKSTGKAHGTVVYSTMQWYFHIVDAAGKRASAEDDAAAWEAEDDADEGRHDYRAPFEDFGKLEREPAQLGDIFVHHSCISMDGFRVFVQGTTVRFSVSVLMDTVQAVDVIPLGPEWEKPLSPEALAQPSLYKVTPTAATVLRYHHLAEQRGDDTGKKCGGVPQSRVGGVSVQWTDMAVIPSAAIPNSVEGQSELVIVCVPPKTGPIPSQTTVASTRSGATTDRAAVRSAPATTTATKGGVDISQSTSATENGSAMPNTVAATGAQVSDASTKEPMCTGAKEALRGGPQLLDVVHPGSITATFLAMDREDQRALQGKPGAPAITPATPAPAKKCDIFDETTMKATEPSVPAAEEVESLGNGTSLKNAFNNHLDTDPSAFSGGGLTSSKNDVTSGHGNTGGTVTQTSGCHSRNVTTTSATATNPAQSSAHNTGSHSQALQNSIDDRKDSCGRASGPILTDFFGDCKDLGLSGDMDEPSISSFSGCGAGRKADKDHCHGNERPAAGAAAAVTGGSNVPVLAHSNTAARKGYEGHRNRELSIGSAAAIAQAAAPLLVNGDFSDSRSRDDAELSEVPVRSNSGGGSDEDEKDSNATTTPSGNTIPDSNPGPAPDWTEVFNLKIANESVKDIMMHKTDFKLIPHHSAKITAAAATPSQMSGGGASLGAAALVPKVVPLSAVGELDSNSLRGMEEDEGVAEASGSRSATGNHSNRGDPVGREANPLLSQPPMHDGNSGQTGTTHLTQDESNGNGDSARPRTGAYKKRSSADGQQMLLKDNAVPALVMVEVASLPPKLAAQVPRGVTIIALPCDTVKELKIKAVSVPRGASSDPASPCLAEVPSAIPVAGEPPTSGSNAHLPFHGSVQTAEGRQVPFSSAARRAGGNVPAHGHTKNTDSEFYHNLVATFDKKTSISTAPPVHGRKCCDSCSPANGRNVFPFTLVPPESQQVSQPLSRTSMERKSDSKLNKSSRRSINTFKTLSHPVPMPQSLVSDLSSPWIQDNAAPSQSLPYPKPQQRSPLQQQIQRSTPSGGQRTSIRVTLGHAGNTTLSQQQHEASNLVFMFFNNTAVLQAATGLRAAPESRGLYPNPCIGAGVGMGTGQQPFMWAPSPALAPAQSLFAPSPPPISSSVQAAPNGAAMSASPQASSQWHPSPRNWRSS
ncbi:hypothetical protein, unknown function [Leishmania mexicana MHOM/GT/2001/U1103]|uniref:Uncharacterized protein n=1 Tax=Leishmania mexicana (strain MHOM/GT/2001/U1103) TaxID=929439 RepID=E9B1T1_LEIMU|nr:hypothetical protein, unknown function [Leishmania mexicana MHOM/GT/2001/U1103]CBZ29188.1 hypothetical protein, unknown function [Leishmania mexicana MHOM/GT/2001/U1103]